MANIELAKEIEKSTKEFHNEFIKILDDLLNTMEGYNELNEDSKKICRIFVCISILYKLKT